MRITAVAALLFLNNCGLTQNADIGISIGGSNYSGDLTESMSISIKQTHPCLGIHGRIELDPMFSFKLQYMYLKVSGDDIYSTKPGNKARNLNFESDIHELSLIGQMQFLNIWSKKSRRLNPYLQIGFSAFRFNPTTSYNGEQVALQPLGTEGQGMIGFDEKYNLISFALDMGFGLRYFVSSRYSVSLDALIRQTTTDYLDDASTNYVSYETLLNNQGKVAADLGNKINAVTGKKRASPGDKDWFESVVLTFSYHLGNNQSFSGSRKNQIRCPSF